MRPEVSDEQLNAFIDGELDAGTLWRIARLSRSLESGAGR